MEEEVMVLLLDILNTIQSQDLAVIGWVTVPVPVAVPGSGGRPTPPPRSGPLWGSPRLPGTATTSPSRMRGEGGGQIHIILTEQEQSSMVGTVTVAVIVQIPVTRTERIHGPTNIIRYSSKESLTHNYSNHQIN